RAWAWGRLLLAFLARHPRVRPDRIILVGVSLGGPIAVAVGGMDPRPAGVASLFGAGLADLLGHAPRARRAARRIHVTSVEPLPKRAVPPSGAVWLDTPLPDPVASVWLRVAAVAG